jgi:hypothetical protein
MDKKVKSILIGHIFIIISGITYSTAWIMIYKSLLPELTNLLIMISLVFGLIGVGLIISGINRIKISKNNKFKNWYIIIICTTLFLFTYFTTLYWFHRELTSEIIFIFLWVALELSSIYVLFFRKYISGLQTIILIILIIISLMIGIICYTIHYTLPDFERFLNGLIPYFIFSLTMLIICLFTIFHKKKV